MNRGRTVELDDLIIGDIFIYDGWYCAIQSKQEDNITCACKEWKSNNNIVPGRVISLPYNTPVVIYKLIGDST